MSDEEYIKNISSVSTEELFNSLEYYGYDSYYAVLWRATIEELKKRSEERPQGEWIEDSYAGIHCSECDYFPLKDVVIKIYADGSRVKRGNWNLTPYCPNCGDDMRGKEKKNE